MERHLSRSENRITGPANATYRAINKIKISLVHLQISNKNTAMLTYKLLCLFCGGCSHETNTKIKNNKVSVCTSNPLNIWFLSSQRKRLTL